MRHKTSRCVFITRLRNDNIAVHKSAEVCSPFAQRKKGRRSLARGYLRHIRPCLVRVCVVRGLSESMFPAFLLEGGQCHTTRNFTPISRAYKIDINKIMISKICIRHDGALYTDNARHLKPRSYSTKWKSFLFVNLN